MLRWRVGVMFSTILPMFKHCSTQLCDLAYLSESISFCSPPTNLCLRQSRPLTFGYCKSHEFVEGLNDCLLRGFSLKNLSWSAVLNIVIFASISLGLEIALLLCPQSSLIRLHIIRASMNTVSFQLLTDVLDARIWRAASTHEYSN